MPRPMLDPLHLDAQTCFPLYAASRLVTRLYQPLLEPLGLTYPQYLVLLLLWQYEAMTVSALGARTYLDSSTLSPLLKKLEAKRLLERTRSAEDERVVQITLTAKGRQLRKRAEHIPLQLFERIGFPIEETVQLKTLLHQLLDCLNTAQSQQP